MKVMDTSHFFFVLARSSMSAPYNGMQNRAYAFILITLMIDAIGIGLVFPIMPDLMDRVGANSTGEGALWGGVLMASYAGALFIFAPIVGSLSDAFTTMHLPEYS